MVVYEFCYCDCIYESAAATVSIHLSKKGAWEAMKKHKLEVYEEWFRMSSSYKKRIKYTFPKAWFIFSTNILP